MKKDNSLVSGALLLTVVHLLMQVLGFAYRVWLSRLVGPVTIGLFQLVMPYYSVIMSLCVSGLTVAVARLTATFGALNNALAVRRVVRYALVGYIALVGLLSLITVPASDLISVHFLGDARTRLGILLLLPCMLLTGWENVHKNFFYGSKNVVPPAVSEVLEQVSRTAAILGLLYFLRPAHEEQQVGLIVLGMIFSEVLSAATLTALFRRRMGGRLTGKPVPRLPQQMLAIAAPVALANVSANLIGSVNTIIIPGRLITSGLGPNEALSAYGVAFGMTMPLLSIPMVFVVAVSLVTLPRLSEAIALGNASAVRRHLRTALTVASVSTLIPSALLIIFGKRLAVALFQNPNAGAFIIELTVATVFVSFESVLHSLLNGMGKQKNAAGNLIAAGCVQLGLTWFFVAVPELRLLGFVYAYILGNALGAALNLRDVLRALRELDSGQLAA